MASPVSDTIYIKADKNTEVTKPDVTLGDVLKIECANPSVLSRVKTLKLLKFHHKDNKKQNRTAVSILKVIACIHEVYPNVEVQNEGEQDFIVTLEEQKTPGGFVHWTKVITVDPTPMEVEMRLYENDIQTTLLETYSRKEKELDVGNANRSGNSGT